MITLEDLNEAINKFKKEKEQIPTFIKLNYNNFNNLSNILGSLCVGAFNSIQILGLRIELASKNIEDNEFLLYNECKKVMFFETKDTTNQEEDYKKWRDLFVSNN